MSASVSTPHLPDVRIAASANVPPDAATAQDQASERRTDTLIPHRLPKQLDKYELISRLGFGNTGNVYLAQRFLVNEGNRTPIGVCAIKVVRRGSQGSSHKEITRNELKILLKLRRANFLGVVQLEESMSDGINRYIVMEFVRGNSLYDAIERINGPLDATYVRCITAELVHSLLFLKSQGIVHRDIKPENILLTARGHAVLA
ncbi:hypothetical protein EW145_g8671, partial [Phellinidium pouzarii]